MSTSPNSRERSASPRPAPDADRRFAFLVALMTPPDERRGERWRSGPDRDAGQDERPEPSSAFGEDEDRAGRLNWRRLNALFFIGCAVAAVLFIIAASFVSG